MSYFFYALSVLIVFVLFFIPLPWDWLYKHPWQRSYDKTYEYLTQQLRGHYFTFEKGIEHTFSSYKNFRTMTELCLDFARKFGSPFRDSLDFLRLKMVEDFRFEKKIYSLFLGSIFQFLVVGLMTWIMVIGLYYIVEIKLPPLPLFFIAIWQLVGILTFVYLFFWRKNLIFATPEVLFQIMLKLLTLSQVGLSFNKVLQLATFEKIEEMKKADDLSSLVSLLRHAVERTIKQGAPIKDEIILALAEWQFLLDRRCELFIKQLEIIKLAVLCLFFVSSYFFLIFQMVSLGIQ